MKKCAAIFMVLIVFSSAEASMVNQQHGEFGAGSIVICPDWLMSQTVKLPSEISYGEYVIPEMRIVPELQGAMLMCFGGLFVIRSGKSV